MLSFYVGQRAFKVRDTYVLEGQFLLAFSIRLLRDKKHWLLQDDIRSTFTSNVGRPSLCLNY